MNQEAREMFDSYMRQQKRIAVERFRRLNRYARKGQIVLAGSSLMEQFPIYEFLLDGQLPWCVYNRGIGGFTTSELMAALPECVLDLEPKHIFLNIGTNDLNGPDYDEAAMLDRYAAILDRIKAALPDTRLYLLAYYPVNPEAADENMCEILRWRTNARIRNASQGVRGLAERYHAAFLDLNDGLTDDQGRLKAEYTIDGMHFYADGYKQVMDKLLPVLEEL